MSQKNDPIWLIERTLSTTPDQFAETLTSYKAELDQIGLKYFETDRIITEQKTIVPDELKNHLGPVVVFGSLHFVRDLKSAFCPGAYGYNGTDYFNLISYVPRDFLLNHDMRVSTWADLKNNSNYWYETFGTNDLFVRPVSDKKTFSGTIIPHSKWTDTIQYLEQSSGVFDTTPIVLARSKLAIYESRFTICNRQIISNHDLTNLEPDLKIMFEQMIQLATQIAGLEWQPDTCYTCDICWTPQGPKVVELNSFCSAGQYGRTTGIVKAVSNQAVLDYYED